MRMNADDIELEKAMEANLDIACKFHVTQAEAAAIVTAHSLQCIADCLEAQRAPVVRTKMRYEGTDVLWCSLCQCYVPSDHEPHIAPDYRIPHFADDPNPRLERPDNTP